MLAGPHLTTASAAALVLVEVLASELFARNKAVVPAASKGILRGDGDDR